MKSAAASSRIVIGGFVAIAACLGATFLIMKPLILTGDETRYFMYAYSILKNGRFLMNLADYQHLVLTNAGYVPTEVPSDSTAFLNSVYLPTVLSPIAVLFGLSGLRAVTLIVGIIGLGYLLRCCRRLASPAGSLLASAVAAFSVPLLPYLHLFYMETFLFTLVCCAWDRLQVSDRRLAGNLLTAVIILAMPFVHIRGSGVAMCLYAALLWQLIRQDKTAHVVVLFGLGIVAFSAFVALNMRIYGSIIGPVGDTRPMPLWQVVSLQFFDVRHGLIAYAPVWLLGYAGLLAGSLRGLSLARQGLALAAVAALTGVGGHAGECWPARYWVMSIPMLAVGLCIVWELGRSIWVRAVTVALTAATLVNSAIFLVTPNMFLENRQTTATYQFLFDKTGLFNFGLMLPVTLDDIDNRRVAIELMIGAFAVIFLLAAAVIGRRQLLYAGPAAVLILAPLDLSRVSVVSPAQYAVADQPGGFEVVFRAPTAADYLQFGKHWEEWSEPDSRRFSVVVTGSDGRRCGDLVVANQVIATSCGARIRSVAVEGKFSGFDFAAQTEARVVVYRSKSLIRRIRDWL